MSKSLETPFSLPQTEQKSIQYEGFHEKLSQDRNLVFYYVFIIDNKRKNEYLSIVSALNLLA
jgi:hypothetical protein